VIIFSLAEEP